MNQKNKSWLEIIVIFMAFVLTDLGLFGDVVSFKQYDKEQREKESEQSVNKITADAMREGYVTAQMILSGMSAPVALHSKIRTSDEKVYAEIAMEAERLALVEAREKFGCRFLFRGDAWTNNSGVAAIMNDGASFIKIADNGAMLQYGARSTFAELVWVDERKGILFEELQKTKSMRIE